MSGATALQVVPAVHKLSLMNQTYLVRFGAMGQIARFTTILCEASELNRGRVVVIRSHRGTELGEILVEEPHIAGCSQQLEEHSILRIAGTSDLEHAQIAANQRESRFEACERLFQDGIWPLELVDVEPLLDEKRTILHYLGPHSLDAYGLCAAIQASCGLDVVLHAVGRDIPEEMERDNSTESLMHAHSCGDCQTSAGGCSTGDGCSACSIEQLLAHRR